MNSIFLTAHSYPSHRFKHFSVYLIFATLSLIGCGPKVSEKYIPPEELNLRFVGMAYTQFLTDNGRSPQSINELKPVLKDFGDPEQLGISPRDGKPYVIVPTGKVLAYEQVGQGGKRFVVDRRFSAWEVDEAEFRKMGLDKK